MSQKKYGLMAATALVISNMVGVGVYTSLGFQVADIQSFTAIVYLWVLGGVIALTGALCYAEISTTLKKSGGEYYYLSEFFGPALGFIGGWVSLLVGFAAPMCAIAIAIGKYSASAFGIEYSEFIPFVILIVMTLLHLLGVRFTEWFQNGFTTLKIILIMIFIGIMFSFESAQEVNFNLIPQAKDWSYLFSTPFYVSLVYVYFSYSGWNASTYVAEVIESPSKNLPRSLIFGTIFVTIIYVLLNCGFLMVSGFEKLAGKVEVADVVARDIWGAQGGVFVSVFLSIGLLGTLSALIITGPRVLEVMGSDYPKLNRFAQKNRFEMPQMAIVAQSLIAGLMILTSSFDYILRYVGLTLSIVSILTVFGIFKLRKQKLSGDFRLKGYPFVPVLFILINVAMSVFLIMDDPMIVVWSAVTMLSGYVVYRFVK